MCRESAENRVTKGFTIVLFTRPYYGDHIKNDVMGGAFSTHRRYVYKFRSQNLQGRDLLETPGVDGRIILKLTLSRFTTGLSLLNLFTSLFKDGIRRSRYFYSIQEQD